MCFKLTIVVFLCVQYIPSDSNIYMSRPLFAQPSRVDQMLEEHDIQLQEFNRQAKKSREGKTDVSKS